MKKLYPKGNGAVFKLCVILLITATAIIYGCKKEISRNKDAASIPAEKTIADAKAWYENTYRAGSSGQPVHTNSTGTGIDLSQSIKPDWEHAANYSRLGKDVIEMPVDPDSKFGTILKKKVNNHAYSKTYTRSSFLLLKGPKGYQAYIMTIVADSSYIKNDPAKLANNTYRQHDADFSGLVLYFTPKGKYINGYAYQNGQLVTSASQVKSSGTTQVQLARICTDWFADVYVDNVLVASVYLYTTCTGEQDPGNSGSPAPPDPCIIVSPPPVTTPPATPNPPSTPPTGPIIPQAIPGGHLTVNNVPGGGGGFPPPLDDNDGPCAEIPLVYTCPDNFSFTSVTSNNLWQEGVLTDIYCNVGIIDPVTLQVSNLKNVTIPQLYFGLAYYNIEGQIVFTQNQAKAIAADAINQAEVDMRLRYKSNPNLTSSQLSEYWISRTGYYMNSITKNRGLAGKTGSINPSNIPPSKRYKPCV